MSLLKSWKEIDLETDDLKLFELVFARTVRHFLPCTEVHFLALEPASRSAGTPDSGTDEVPSSWETGAAMVTKSRQPVVDRDRLRLYLPIWKKEDLLGIAILGAEEHTLFEASSNWLLERSRILSEQFLHIKQWAVDPLSGLLNGRFFLEEIDALLQEKKKIIAGEGIMEGRPCGKRTDDAIFSPWLSVALLEIYPQRAKRIEQAIRHSEQVALCLESMAGWHVPVHCFGDGLFAMILNGVSVEQSLKMGKTLLRWLRQENFRNARLGLNTLEMSLLPSDRQGLEEAARELVEHAMDALSEAGNRGPSALFNWAGRHNSSLAAMDLPSERTVAAMSRLWKGRKSFAVACLKAEENGAALSGRKFLSLLGQPAAAESDREVFVFFSDMDKERIFSWLQTLRRALSEPAGKRDLPAEEFLAGIAFYPCLDFSRRQILANARKALLHARFLGPASQAVFDHVSLNISGDVHYNEGDLPTAMREYRKGLRLNPSSINLLNSLGVCEAQMNRQVHAMRLFEKVLEQDPRDFMALYNLGFACLQSGRREGALEYFQRAHALDGNNVDLVLQLAKLYCSTARFAEAKALLQPLAAEQGGEEFAENRVRAKAYRFLGEALQGLGKGEQAIVALQQAMQYEPGDATSLSLLGYLYGETDQGDDIALSLCRRAVEIDGGKWRYWYHLGAVLHKRRSFEEAEVALKTCLRLKRQEPDVLELLARVYEKMGKTRQAEKVRSGLGIKAGHGKKVAQRRRAGSDGEN